MAKIAISLADDILEQVEAERKARGESRSEFVRHALEMFLRSKKERAAVQRYVHGYREQPEGQEDSAWIAASREAFAANPWEDEKK